MEEITTRLEQIRNERLEFNLSLPDPIIESTIGDFIKKFKSYFGKEVEEQYLNFLKICDGLDENGYQIYSSFNHTVKKTVWGIFENNELFYEQDEEDRKYILFAASGSDLYVFNKKESQYQLLDRYSGDVFNTFQSFNVMLLYILKLMLYEDTE